MINMAILGSYVRFQGCKVFFFHGSFRPTDLGPLGGWQIPWGLGLEGDVRPGLTSKRPKAWLAVMA